MNHGREQNVPSKWVYGDTLVLRRLKKVNTRDNRTVATVRTVEEMEVKGEVPATAIFLAFHFSFRAVPILAAGER